MLCVCVCVLGGRLPQSDEGIKRGPTSPREGVLPADAFPRGLQAVSTRQIMDLPASRIL